MIQLSKWNWLLGHFRIAINHEGITYNFRRYPYPGMDESVSVKTRGPFIMFRWGAKALHFWRSSLLLEALDRILKARLNYWREHYSPVHDALNTRAESFHRALGEHSRYIRSSHLERFINTFPFDLPALEETAWLALGFNLDSKTRSFMSFLNNPNSFQETFNNTWMNSELQNNQQLFDQLEEHPLTDSQRKSCVVDEDNILVLAGAGTGKTSTMVAKAKYLVANGYADPHEIMMLAYGKDAQAELRERVDEHTELAAVQVSTFHSAGKHIINFHEKNTVSRLATDEKTYIKFVETQIQEMLKDNTVSKHFNLFATGYLYPKPNDLAFKSQGQYLRYVKDNELRALSGDLVKSFEELTIANYLFSQGIKFEYEKPYPYASPEPGRGGYQPDFYLPDFDVYLEHFGIDKNGNTRSGIDAEKYNEDMEWKRNFHAENNTVLWETFSWQSHRPGGLSQVLENKIKDYCHTNQIKEEYVFNTVSSTGIYNRLKELGLVSGFSKLLANFLSLFKASSMGLEAIRVGKLDDYNFTRWELFKKIFLWLYTAINPFYLRIILSILRT
jgi:DNA helicase IV